jgi:hypothetical protein
MLDQDQDKKIGSENQDHASPGTELEAEQFSYAETSCLVKFRYSQLFHVILDPMFCDLV